MSVLVYTENKEGRFKKSAFEIVSYAAAVAKQLNTSLTAVSLGSVNEEELKKLGTYGATKIISVADDRLKTFNLQPYVSAISAVAKAEQSKVVIMQSSFSGKGIAPRLSI